MKTIDDIMKYQLNLVDHTIEDVLYSILYPIRPDDLRFYKGLPKKNIKKKK